MELAHDFLRKGIALVADQPKNKFMFAEELVLLGLNGEFFKLLADEDSRMRFFGKPAHKPIDLTRNRWKSLIKSSRIITATSRRKTNGLPGPVTTR